MPRKILFFIEALCSGGKERRFIELLCYLKANTDFKMQLVLMSEEIHYSYVLDLNIPVAVIKRKGLKYDPGVFRRFYLIARKFNPDIIHTWSIMTTFYAIPCSLLLKRPIVANLVSNAKMKFSKWSLSNLFLRTSCYRAQKILANSNAGLKAYGITSPKSVVVHNGVRLDRFSGINGFDYLRETYGITSRFIVTMVATFTINKNYDFFLDVAKLVRTVRPDITFVGVGNGPFFSKIKERIDKEEINNVILTGEQKNVEKFIAASDIAVLFTNNKYHREGISNSIIEYMALGKPVITTDKNGGSLEIVEDGKSGFILEENARLVTRKIIELISDEELRKSMGSQGKEIIKSRFSIEKMGNRFTTIYDEVLM